MLPSQGAARLRGVRGAAREVRRRLAVAGRRRTRIRALTQVEDFCEEKREAAWPSTRGCRPRARRQLDAAQRHAQELGMPLGLYVDLALGADRGGAEVWADQDVVRGRRVVRRAARRVQSARPGLGPAAVFAARAARHGLPAVHRAAARQHARRRRAAHGPRHGADRACGGSRRARSPSAAAMSTIRSASCSRCSPRESRRARCLVIGEDLGTVPAELRAALNAGGRALLPAAAVREGRRRRVLPAGGLSARRAGVRHHARPADLARLLGRAST